MEALEAGETNFASFSPQVSPAELSCCDQSSVRGASFSPPPASWDWPGLSHYPDMRRSLDILISSLGNTKKCVSLSWTEVGHSIA